MIEAAPGTLGETAAERWSSFFEFVWWSDSDGTLIGDFDGDGACDYLAASDPGVTRKALTLDEPGYDMFGDPAFGRTGKLHLWLADAATYEPGRRTRLRTRAGPGRRST